LAQHFPHVSSGYDAECIACVNRLAVFHVEALHSAALRRANFVLHFHRFHNEQALARLDLLAHFDKHADHFAWHGSDDLLPPFRFNCAMTPAMPRARIYNLGGEFLQSSL
jgi:hypothetical protein